MSTPLSQIRTMSDEEPTMKNNELDNNENNLVSEILKEIESNENKNSQEAEVSNNNMQPSIETNPIEQQDMGAMNPDISAPNMYNQMGTPDQMMNNMGQVPMMPPGYMNQHSQMMGQPNQMLGNSNQMVNEKKPENLVEKIINEFKQPLIVAMIFVLLSIPQVNTVLLGVLPKKSFVINNSNIVLTLLKSIVIASLFYGINKSL